MTNTSDIQQARDVLERRSRGQLLVLTPTMVEWIDRMLSAAADEVCAANGRLSSVDEPGWIESITELAAAIIAADERMSA